MLVIYSTSASDGERYIGQSYSTKSLKAYDLQLKDFHVTVIFKKTKIKRTFYSIFSPFERWKKCQQLVVVQLFNNQLQISSFSWQQTSKFSSIDVALKKFVAGYKRKTEFAFTKEGIMHFLKTAPNNREFFHMKAVIFWCSEMRRPYQFRCPWPSIPRIHRHVGKLCYLKAEEEWVRNRFHIPIEFCSYFEAYDHAKKIAVLLVKAGWCSLTIVRKDGNGYFTKQPIGDNFFGSLPSKWLSFWICRILKNTRDMPSGGLAQVL